MNTTRRRRLAAALAPLMAACALTIESGATAQAATVPTSYIVTQSGEAVFSPNGLTATLAVPPQCAGSHAAIAITNYTFATYTIEYYGGNVPIPSAATHVFCIGGTADHYQIQYAILGEYNIVLRVNVP